MNILTPVHILLLAAMILSFAGCKKETSSSLQSPASGQTKGLPINPHLLRGRDWMDLHSYDQARLELVSAISEEPKNVEARLLVAKSYVLEGNLTESLKWAIETQKVASKNPGLDEIFGRIRIQAGDHLGQGEVQERRMALRVLTAVADKSSIPPLRRSMGDQDDQFSEDAELLLRKLDGGKANEELKVLMGHVDENIRLRAARRLWKLNRDATAVPVIVSVGTAKIMIPRNEEGGNYKYAEYERRIKGVAEISTELGYEASRPIFLAGLANAASINDNAFAECLNQIINHKDSSVVPELQHLLEEFKKNDLGAICVAPGVYVVRALAALGDKSVTPTLKDALGHAFVKTGELEHTKWIADMVGLLAAVDSKEWEKFQWWYKAGWLEPQKILYDVGKLRGDYGGSGQNPIDERSPSSGETRRFIESLGPKQLLGGDRYALELRRVEVLDPEKMNLICAILDSRKKSEGAVTMHLRATGDSDRAWVISSLTNLINP